MRGWSEGEGYHTNDAIIQHLLVPTDNLMYKKPPNDSPGLSTCGWSMKASSSSLISAWTHSPKACTVGMSPSILEV